jgi:hypothetical protein
MASDRKAVKVLRLWYRMSKMSEVQSLSAVSRWWLYGVTMEWTGFNNGVIEFCRIRHGTAWGLDDRKVFARARRDVLATGLVEMVREGGRNLPARYLLTLVEIQV